MGTAPDSVGFRIPNTATPDPNDSLSVSQLTNGSFQSSIDWDTGINLPILFRGSWKLQPVVGIANTTSGAFAIRNRNTNGNFVRQGKRFRFGVTAAPTLFGFLPGPRTAGPDQAQPVADHYVELPAGRHDSPGVCACHRGEWAAGATSQ